MISIAVIDYESGNLRSVCRALEKAGAQPNVTSDGHSILDSDAVVLPGVGSGNAAMAALNARNLVEPIKEFINSGRPLLGICLGLQLLMDRTMEGDKPCLALVPGTTKRLPNGLKVPHMGWNSVNTSIDHPLMEGIPQGSYFYFVHSFYADPYDRRVVAGSTRYGITFCSLLTKGNVIATQFHPEKSGPLGLRMYSNFIHYAKDIIRSNTRLP